MNRPRQPSAEGDELDHKLAAEAARESNVDLADFVRVVDEVEYTQSEKILVRNLKAVHFDRNRLPDAPLFFRVRGDTTFRPFTPSEYAKVREEFAAREKLDSLDR
jgi:hypothetical protein